MKTYPVEYEIELYNEIEEKVENVKGVTFAETYTEAVKKIEKYYGEEIINLFLYMLEENEIYEFNNMKDKYMHGMFKLNGNITRWKGN